MISGERLSEDLRQQAYVFLTLVRNPTAEEKEALEVKRGLVFFL